MQSFENINLMFMVVNHVAGKNHSIATKWKIHTMICLEKQLMGYLVEGHYNFDPLACNILKCDVFTPKPCIGVIKPLNQP